MTEIPTEEPEKTTEIEDPTDEPISEKPEYPYLDIEDVLSSPVSPYAAHVFSHQGTAKEECSETFAAYDLAILYGSRCLEQDLVISSDGILYCSHDLSPERLTGEQRQFSEMTSREIDALRTETGNLCIPRLSAVFARYGKAVTYVIELRPGEEILQRFLELVSEYEMQDNVILQSSELDVLQRIEEIYPDMPKLFLSFNKDQLALALQADHVDIIAVSGGLFTQAYCDKVHAAGKQYCVCCKCNKLHPKGH